MSPRTCYPIHTHHNEDAALQYIEDNPLDQQLALIVLHQISPFRVNYELRMEYSTLPNTNQVLRRTDLGLSEDYNMYYFLASYPCSRPSTTGYGSTQEQLLLRTLQVLATLRQPMWIPRVGCYRSRTSLCAPSQSLLCSLSRSVGMKRIRSITGWVICWG